MLAREVTSKPSSGSASSARTSASCRARRRSAPTAGLEIAHQALKSEPIAGRAESGDDAHGQIRQQRAAALWLPREDVGEEDLDERDAHRDQDNPPREAALGGRTG